MQRAAFLPTSVFCDQHRNTPAWKWSQIFATMLLQCNDDAPLLRSKDALQNLYVIETGIDVFL